MSKTGKYIIGVIVVVLVIWGISAANKAPKETGPIKIGVLSPMTGDAAPYGESLKNAIEVVAKEVSDAGGINSRPLTFIYEDGRCAGKDAATAAQKLINVDKVKYIVGLPCSGEVLAVAPISEPAKVIMLVQGSNPAITDAGQYIFRTFPNDLLSSKTIADHAIKNGLKTAAFITENTEYAVGMDKVATKDYQDAGGKLLISETYEPKQTDFRTILTKIKATNPEMMFINAQVGANAARIAKQARELGIKAQFYTFFLSGDDFVKSSPAVNGTYVIDAPTLDTQNLKTQEFLKAYNSLNGKDPAYPFFAGGAYDEASLLVQAIKAVGSENTDAIKDYLYGVKSYSGVIGTFHFNEGGDVVGIPLRVLQVVDNKIVDAK